MNYYYSRAGAFLCFFLLLQIGSVTAQAASIAAIQSDGAGNCSLRNVRGCETTNDLMWALGTKSEIRKFLGKERGNFFFANPKVSAANDAIEALGGASEPRADFPDGLTLFNSCRLHSCREKGAILFGHAGKILAIAIAHFQCGQVRCNEHYTLTVFIRDKSEWSRVEPLLLDHITDVAVDRAEMRYVKG